MEQPNHKTTGIFHLVFVKLMHKCLAVVEILSEFSKYTSEISDVFYSSCVSSLKIVVHKCIYCQKVRA